MNELSNSVVLYLSIHYHICRDHRSWFIFIKHCNLKVCWTTILYWIKALEHYGNIVARYAAQFCIMSTGGIPSGLYLGKSTWWPVSKNNSSNRSCPRDWRFSASWEPNWEPPWNPRRSQNYLMEEVKGSLQLGPHYAERRHNGNGVIMTT